MRLRDFYVPVLALALGIAVPGTAQERQVTIRNPGFEAQQLRQGGWNFEIRDWQITNRGDRKKAGTWRPDGFNFPNGKARGIPGVPEGSQIAFTDGAIVSQQLAERFEPNKVYRLRVMVGSRTRLNTSDGFSIELRAGGETLRRVGSRSGLVTTKRTNDAMSRYALRPTQGEFQQAEMLYYAPAGHAKAGHPLEVRLQGFGMRVQFDDVSLTVANRGAAGIAEQVEVGNGGFDEGLNVASPSGYWDPIGWVGMRGKAIKMDSYCPLIGGTMEGVGALRVDYYPGGISRTLAARFEGNRSYRLEVTAGNPDYNQADRPGLAPRVSLWAAGQQLRAFTFDAMAAGRIETAAMEVYIPAGSPADGKPIEIRIDTPKPGRECLIDDVVLTKQGAGVLATTVVDLARGKLAVMPRGKDPMNAVDGDLNTAAAVERWGIEIDLGAERELGELLITSKWIGRFSVRTRGEGVGKYYRVGAGIGSSSSTQHSVDLEGHRARFVRVRPLGANWRPSYSVGDGPSIFDLKVMGKLPVARLEGNYIVRSGADHDRTLLIDYSPSLISGTVNTRWTRHMMAAPSRAKLANHPIYSLFGNPPEWSDALKEEAERHAVVEGYLRVQSLNARQHRYRVGFGQVIRKWDRDRKQWKKTVRPPRDWREYVILPVADEAGRATYEIRSVRNPEFECMTMGEARSHSMLGKRLANVGPVTLWVPQFPPPRDARHLQDRIRYASFHHMRPRTEWTFNEISMQPETGGSEQRWAFERIFFSQQERDCALGLVTQGPRIGYAISESLGNDIIKGAVSFSTSAGNTKSGARKPDGSIEKRLGVEKNAWADVDINGDVKLLGLNLRLLDIELEARAQRGEWKGETASTRYLAPKAVASGRLYLRALHKTFAYENEADLARFEQTITFPVYGVSKKFRFSKKILFVRVGFTVKIDAGLLGKMTPSLTLVNSTALEPSADADLECYLGGHVTASASVTVGRLITVGINADLRILAYHPKFELRFKDGFADGYLTHRLLGPRLVLELDLDLFSVEIVDVTLGHKSWRQRLVHTKL